MTRESERKTGLAATRLPSTTLRPALLMAISALGLVMATASAPAHADRGARGGGGQMQRQGMPRGGFETHTQRQRVDGGFRRDRTVTGPDGRQATSNTTVTHDREAGTRTRTQEQSLPNGRTRSVTDTMTRTDTGYTRNTESTRTLPDGTTQTAARDVVVTRDKETGTATRSVDSVGYNGQTRSVDQTIQRTDTGFTSSATLTGPQGTSTRETELNRNDSGFTRETTFTNPQGQTTTTTVEVDRDPATGTVTRDRTRTP